MPSVDRRVGAALTLLGVLVLWSARAFPDVPGQKLGASFLPMLVGAGLAACGLALMLRARREVAALPVARAREQIVPALVVIAAIAFYVLAAERLGFLIVAPLALVAVCRGLRESWGASIAWALGGTAVVHLVFYKLLRVPLPWGVLRPFY